MSSTPFDINQLFGGLISGATTLLAGKPAEAAAPPPPPPPPPPPAKSNTLTYVLIGAGVLVATVIAVVALKRK